MGRPREMEDGHIELEVEEWAEKLAKYPTKKVGRALRKHLVSNQDKHSKPVRYPNLKLHLFTSMLVALQLIVNLAYLVMKFRLYIRWYDEVLEYPWLLAILLCECAYFFCSSISAVDHFLPEVSRPKPVIKDGQRYPTIDIFLPCCKEPTEVPRDSIMAALASKYPKERFRVVVLDDGGDDQLKAICEDLQAEKYGEQLVYLRRQKVPGVPHNFKCGNLNYGLEHSTAEFVVMMDADMIVHRTFLQEFIPYILNSPDVAFVQIPQAFYNLPLGDPLNDACVMGYDRVLVRRDGYHGTATCIGTGAIFRRQCLDEIGGFQPQSITEDTMTAFVLFNHGYKSVYLNEKLQIGLTPWTFQGYIKQRQRWGQGAMQQFRASWKAMLGPKSRLNFVQKCLYFWHTGYYLMSIFNVILLAVLLSVLAFRLNLIIGTDRENRNVFVLLATLLLTWRLSWICLWLTVPQPIQSRNRDESHFWWMTPFFFIMLLQTFFNFKSTFNFVPTSTIDRAASAGRGRLRGNALFKQLEQLKHLMANILLALTAVGVVVWRLSEAITYYGFSDCNHTFTVVGISLFLITTSAHMLLPVMYVVWPTGYKPHQRKPLLKYDADGVPHFNREDCLPKFYWSVWIYELLTYVFLAFWGGVLYIYFTDADAKWCRRSEYE